jgi:hypothetical protein
MFADTDMAGCPWENRGCMFNDHVEGTDCTTGGSDTCRTMGADYCSAMVGGRRVCCMVTRTTTPELTGTNIYSTNHNKLSATTDEQCPDWNRGCIFTDYVNGTDCTTSGTPSCTTAGHATTTTSSTSTTATDTTTTITTRTAYCSAPTGTDKRRVCCQTHLFTANMPTTTETTPTQDTKTTTNFEFESTDTRMGKFDVKSRKNNHRLV